MLDVKTLFQIVKDRLTKSQLEKAKLLLTNLKNKMVEPGGIEPPTPCLQSRCSPS